MVFKARYYLTRSLTYEASRKIWLVSKTITYLGITIFLWLHMTHVSWFEHRTRLRIIQIKQLLMIRVQIVPLWEKGLNHLPLPGIATSPKDNTPLVPIYNFMLSIKFLHILLLYVDLHTVFSSAYVAVTYQNRIQSKKTLWQTFLFHSNNMSSPSHSSFN